MAVTNARERAIINVLRKNESEITDGYEYYLGNPSEVDAGLAKIAREILADPMIVELSGREGMGEAYGALKIAEEIIGLLNTAIPRGLPDDNDRKRRNLRRDVAELENPFDSDAFVNQLKQFVDQFSKITGSNAIAVHQILDLIDTDMAHRRLPNARAKITDLSLYFMDQTRSFLKRQHPW